MPDALSCFGTEALCEIRLEQVTLSGGRHENVVEFARGGRLKFVISRRFAHACTDLRNQTLGVVLGERVDFLPGLLHQSLARIESKQVDQFFPPHQLHTRWPDRRPEACIRSPYRFHYNLSVVWT